MRIQSATEDLAWAVRGLSLEALHHRPDAGEWTIHEHLAHLRDMEQEVYLPLLRWAAVPDMLDPLDYSRKEWHEHRYRPAEAAAVVVNDLMRIRDEELVIVREMSNHVWTRWREDTRWGPLTAKWIAEVIYRHVLDHLQGVMGIVQDVHLAALAPAGPGQERGR